MTLVYAWPPVGVVASEWTIDAPVNVSRSLITGARRVSATQRRRRMVSLEVSSLARGANGAGYMEMLKRFIDGGVNLIRLESRPVNWWADAQIEASGRQSREVQWRSGSEDVSWDQDGSDVIWIDGTLLSGTAGSDGTFPTLTVSGLTPNRRAARPGEFVTLKSGGTVQTGQVVTEAFANAQGVAVLRIFEALTGSGIVNIGVSESAVFEATTIPRAVQPLNVDWSYSWQFAQVFEDEVDGFEEVDPWN
ncbi:hypothetical protein ABEB22_12550 [Thioclava sp. 'Guangxiensis']|uniref:hypothetical protein n=1 Tax=Thioclava sp. 'Guangxiensis' TaxID=3149044 RepID=UPI0038784183